jgi:hypothetical protein
MFYTNLEKKVRGTFEEIISPSMKQSISQHNHDCAIHILTNKLKKD